MTKRSLPLSEVYGLLETGPVVLLTTTYKGKANVAHHDGVRAAPGRVRGQPQRLQFESLRKTRQCVLNIPTADLAPQVVKCGNTSGRDVDKFEASGPTTAPARLVGATLINECFANLECRVADTRLLNRYDFFVLEVLKAWIEPDCKDPRTLHHRGHGVFMVTGETISLPSRMK